MSILQALRKLGSQSWLNTYNTGSGTLVQGNITANSVIFGESKDPLGKLPMLSPTMQETMTTRHQNFKLSENGYLLAHSRACKAPTSQTAFLSWISGFLILSNFAIGRVVGDLGSFDARASKVRERCVSQRVQAVKYRDFEN